MPARIRVRFLGALRHALGAEEVVVEARNEPTVDELLDLIEERLPGFKRVLRELEDRGIGALAVVNGVALRRGDRVRDGATVYFKPPTSGGSTRP